MGRLSGERDLAAGQIAAGRKTLVTSEELAACGFGRDAVAYRVRTGRLHVVFTGVYSVGCGVLPPLARDLAALLSCGKGSFLSHRSAAFVWGMRKEPPAVVEVSVVGRECKSREGIVVHRVRRVERQEVRRHEGLWVSCFEADFVWREQRLIVELDSETYHSGPGAVQRDREKDLTFRGAGFDVMRPTRAHVVYQGPRVLVLVARALA